MSITKLIPYLIVEWLKSSHSLGTIYKPTQPEYTSAQWSGAWCNFVTKNVSPILPACQYSSSSNILLWQYQHCQPVETTLVLRKRWKKSNLRTPILELLETALLYCCIHNVNNIFESIIQKFLQYIGRSKTGNTIFQE